MTSQTKIPKKKRKVQSQDLAFNDSNLALYYLPELMWGLGMPMSQRNALSQLFYDRFLLYFTSSGENEDIQNRMTWLHRLPDMSTDGTNNALSLALYAAASAFSGMKTRNLALVQDACNVYGKALQLHGKVIQQRGKKGKITAHMVSTSVLLSIFEAMNATSSEAYRGHVCGAARMVQLVGPDQCMFGVMCQLYFHIRTQMAFVYLTTRKEDRSETVPAEQILRENLEYRKIPIFQRLVTFITRLSEQYIELEDGAGENGATKQILDLEVFLEVKDGVDALWQEFALAAEEKGQRLQWQNEQGDTMYRNPFTALCIAFFAAAHILFAMLAPRLAVSYPDFTDYYQKILEVAAFLRAFRIGCAYMRMAAPLYLVGLHAPQQQQRTTAIVYFDEWRKMGMGGISALALESIERRKDQMAVRGGGRVEEARFPTLDLCVKTSVLESFAERVQ
ncbi:hypothetical protein P280DRAFT_468180 [Massarina eburnea CBS 473.64]|uniref:Transcription factor domain-containing protein n=1 Tax=Massarina eburnea CBS 473.64 TaxID=1395130 RepID=A0A6A6S4P2_9PLEO|nr:hypothetical protein P280DRAFT_468180 [Massarina eburnea CBS 473.64]